MYTAPVLYTCGCGGVPELLYLFDSCVLVFYYIQRTGSLLQASSSGWGPGSSVD